MFLGKNHSHRWAAEEGQLPWLQTAATCVLMLGTTVWWWSALHGGLDMVAVLHNIQVAVMSPTQPQVQHITSTHRAISPLCFSDLGWLRVYADTTGVKYA